MSIAGWAVIDLYTFATLSQDTTVSFPPQKNSAG